MLLVVNYIKYDLNVLMLTMALLIPSTALKLVMTLFQQSTLDNTLITTCYTAVSKFVYPQ